MSDRTCYLCEPSRRRCAHFIVPGTDTDIAKSSGDPKLRGPADFKAVVTESAGLGVNVDYRGIEEPLGMGSHQWCLELRRRSHHPSRQAPIT
jgi:hypothetical protein